MNPSSPQPPQLIAPLPPGGVFSGPPYAKLPRSHKGLIRIVFALVGAAIIVAAGLAIYRLYIAPPAQALNASNTYVKALSTGDVDLAAYMSVDETDFSLLASAAQALHGERTLVSKTERSGTYYFLYDLTNETNKYARTIVVQTKKGYRVSSLEYSAQTLALVPGETAPSNGGAVAVAQPAGSTASTSGAAAIGASSASTGSGTSSNNSNTSRGSKGSVAALCLEQADYAVFDDGDSQAWSAASPYSTTIGFNAGSSDYVDEFEVGDVYAVWVKFYQSTASKNYTIHVRGDITSADATGLANSRASKVKAALAAVGIQAGRVIIDAPTTVASNPDDDSVGNTVTMLIIPGSGC